MEKVKITQEQADAIEKGLSNNDWSKDGMLSIHAEKYEKFSSSAWGYPYESLNELHIGKLARILFIGYEVEPKFKAGDWVTDIHQRNNVTGQITKIDTDPDGYKLAWGYFSYDDRETNFSFEEIRHATLEEIATEKTRRWWAKNDRDVGELRMTDIVFYDDNHWGGIYIVYSDVFIASDKKASVKLYNRHRREITIAVSKLRVICFAQDRKDISLPSAPELQETPEF
jgi:hypothetical protein